MKIDLTTIQFREESRNYLHGSISINGTPFHVEAVQVYPADVDPVQSATTEKNDKWITDRIGNDRPYQTAKIEGWPGEWIIAITPRRG